VVRVKAHDSSASGSAGLRLRVNQRNNGHPFFSPFWVIEIMRGCVRLSHRVLPPCAKPYALDDLLGVFDPNPVADALGRRVEIRFLSRKPRIA
jgi:hypothetical protein